MDIESIVETLSPIERKVVPFLAEKKISKIVEKSGLDETSVMRALQFLENKGIVKLELKKEKY